MPTTNGPRACCSIPKRNLFVTPPEVDDAAAQVRASVGVYHLERGRSAFPSIMSTTEKESGQPRVPASEDPLTRTL